MDVGSRCGHWARSLNRDVISGQCVFKAYQLYIPIFFYSFFSAIS